jgi:hypothetical protein
MLVTMGKQKQHKYRGFRHFLVDLPRFPRDQSLFARVPRAGKARAAALPNPQCTLGAIASCARHTAAFIVTGVMGAWRRRTS